MIFSQSSVAIYLCLMTLKRFKKSKIVLERHRKASDQHVSGVDAVRSDGQCKILELARLHNP